MKLTDFIFVKSDGCLMKNAILFINFTDFMFVNVCDF